MGRARQDDGLCCQQAHVPRLGATRVRRGPSGVVVSLPTWCLLFCQIAPGAASCVRTFLHSWRRGGAGFSGTSSRRRGCAVTPHPHPASPSASLTVVAADRTLREALWGPQNSTCVSGPEPLVRPRVRQACLWPSVCRRGLRRHKSHPSCFLPGKAHLGFVSWSFVYSTWRNKVFSGPLSPAGRGGKGHCQLAVGIDGCPTEPFGKSSCVLQESSGFRGQIGPAPAGPCVCLLPSPPGQAGVSQLAAPEGLPGPPWRCCHSGPALSSSRPSPSGSGPAKTARAPPAADPVSPCRASPSVSLMLAGVG